MKAKFYNYEQEVRVLRTLNKDMMVGITTINFNDGAKEMLCLIEPVYYWMDYLHDEGGYYYYDHEEITLYGNHTVLSFLREKGYKREYDFALSYLYRKGINYIPSEYFYYGKDSYRIEETL